MILFKLKRQLTTLIISIFISVFIINTSYNYWKSSFHDVQIIKKNIEITQQKYYSALNHQKKLTLYAEKYLFLEKSGLVGDANRINWVNTLESIIDIQKIPYVKFKLYKTLPFNSDSISQNYPGIDLFTTDMTLSMQLLHEADLLNLLNMLEDKAQGFFDIMNCTITRNLSTNSSLLNKLSDKNFKAICSLTWYTINKSSKELKIMEYIYE